MKLSQEGASVFTSWIKSQPLFFFSALHIVLIVMLMLLFVVLKYVFLGLFCHCIDAQLGCVVLRCCATKQVGKPCSAGTQVQRP